MANSVLSQVTTRCLKNPSEAEINRVVAVLLAAFDNGQHGDPFTRFLVGGDMSLVPRKFGANVRAAAIGGEIHVASIGVEPGDIIGAALWYGPGKASMATEDQRAAGWSDFLATISNELREWYTDHFIPIMVRLSDEGLGPGLKLQSWYLLLFGVVPEHQKKGVGRALMSNAEELAKADGVAMVLETTTEEDVTIYKRLGFEIKGEAEVTSRFGTSPVYVMMKRP